MSVKRYEEIYRLYKDIIYRTRNLEGLNNKKHRENLEIYEKINSVLNKGADDNIANEFSQSVISRINNLSEKMYELSIDFFSIIDESYDIDVVNKVNIYIRNINEILLQIEGLMSDTYRNSRMVDKVAIKEIKNLQKKSKEIEYIVSNLSNMEAVARNNADNIQKFQRDLQNKLNVLDSNINSITEELNIKFDIYLNEKEKTINLMNVNAQNKLVEELNKLKVKYDEVKESLLDETKNINNELKETLAKANLLVSAAGEKALNDGYKEYAKQAGGAKKCGNG